MSSNRSSFYDRSHTLVSALQDKTASTPDLELIGHEDDAEFALGMCSSEPLVASGGKDKNVIFPSLDS